MPTSLLKRQVYAGLMEILKDQKYYYRSGIDSNFNRLTDDGRDAVAKYMLIMAPHMLRDEDETMDMRAKQMVIEELKK